MTAVEEGRLAGELVSLVPSVVGRQVDAGSVTSVSPLRVRFPGESADVPVLVVEHVSPVVGRQVVVVRVGAEWVVVGQMGAS